MWDKSKCTKCGDCFVNCQYLQYPRKKAVKNITALVEGNFFGGDTADVLWDCITCAACNEYCPQGAEPFDLICNTRREQGISVFPKAARAWTEARKAKSNNEIIKGKPGRPVISLGIMKDVYWPEARFEGKIWDGLSMIKGIDYRCYTGTYLHFSERVELDFMKNGIQGMVNNIGKALDSLGAKEVILWHDECYSSLTTFASRFGINVPFKPVHIVEYLLDVVKKNAKSIKKLDKKIAYQRPCSSRVNPKGIVDPVVDEIFEAIGVERVKRKYDGLDALCCGGYIQGRSHEIYMKSAQMNWADALSHGAETMITLCQGCQLNHEVQQKRLNPGGPKPLWIGDLCRVAMGEIPYPAKKS